MAKIITEDGQEREVEDGEEIQKACDELGIPFGCTEGVCGTCMIEVIEGKENLSEMTQEEKDMGMDGDTRLACQCTIKEGSIKIKY